MKEDSSNMFKNHQSHSLIIMKKHPRKEAWDANELDLSQRLFEALSDS